MNKNSIIPMYQQLADTIKEQILSGELQDSDKLMTEAELGEKYHVSRITVRKAINICRKTVCDEETGNRHFCHNQ